MKECQHRHEISKVDKAYLASCGYTGDIQSLGDGQKHKAFLYTAPEGKKVVVKIPTLSGKFSNSQRMEQENIDMLNHYFGPYTVPTKIVPSPTSHHFCIEMEYVDGEKLSNKMLQPGYPNSQRIREELHNLLARNKHMLGNTNTSFDPFGIEGIWEGSTFPRFRGNPPIHLANIFVTKVPEEGTMLKIIDHDLFRLNAKDNNGYLWNSFINRIAVGNTRRGLRKHFGMQ